MRKKAAKKGKKSSAKRTEVEASLRKGEEIVLEENNITYIRDENNFWNAAIWVEENKEHNRFSIDTDDFDAAKEWFEKQEYRINTFGWDNYLFGDNEERRTTKDRKIGRNILLFKRKKSRRWQAKIRRSVGSWIDYTTGTEDFDEAVINAKGKLEEIKWRQENNKVDITKKFSDLCAVAKRQLLAEYEKTNRTQLKDKVRVIDKYLVPILGQYKTHNITHSVLLEFDEKRQALLGRQLSKSAIATHNSALNYVFELAKANNNIIEIPILPKSGAASDKIRTHFKNDEYRKLCNFMWRDLQRREKLINTSGFDKRSFEISALLRDIVLILANTGIRTGNELLNLKWNNVRITTQNGEENIEFNLVKTKTHMNRKVVSYEPTRKNQKDKRYGSWSCLERIRDRFDDTKGLSWEELTKKDIYIFRLETSKKVVRNEALSKNFKKLLQRCDLLKDEFGNDRVLYSLRHTYASRRRYDGMSYDDLSVVMGTSTELLRKVYSHFEATDNPNLFSGHLRRQKKVAEDTEAEWKIKLEKSLEKQATQIEKLLEQNAELTDKLIQTKN